jgi:SpoVK/Ycf46/Vps4 family AAA+-type ATPase
MMNETLDEKRDSMFEDYDDFEKLLMDFVNDGFEKVEEDVSEETTEDDEELLDDEPEENVDNDVDEDEDDTPTVSSGEIEQNDTHSVKVQILHPIKNARKELDRLVGCRDIKRRMDELLSLTRYNNMKREMCPDSKQHEVSLHSVFFGRPGTGKTTVCKIFGSLLHDVGALSKGHVVVCDRSTFIGTLWGDEERAMRQVVDLARGGVLMLDEAYLLNGQNTNDPGKMVIQLLMNLLADEKQRDLAVVICGYKEPMMKLLETNPGLHSRFPNRFEFADFSFEELLDITQQRIREYDYHFTRSAWEKYKQVLQEAYAQRDPMTWGNARFIANQLDRIYLQHARRCVNHSKKMDRQHLQTLTPADIMPMEVQKRRPHVGF